LEVDIKKIVIVVRALPFNTPRNAEALRCAVGMTLEDDNHVSVAFVGDGVWTAASLDSEAASSRDLRKHVEALEMMEAEMMAEQETLAARNLEPSFQGIEIKPRDLIDGLIKDADVVMPF
jgi:sulfur relay (sulfurtransferase) DsrF/TusC family protein